MNEWKALVGNQPEYNPLSWCELPACTPTLSRYFTLPQLSSKAASFYPQTLALLLSVKKDMISRLPIRNLFNILILCEFYICGKKGGDGYRFSVEGHLL
jgi:hypothetical protein